MTSDVSKVMFRVAMPEDVDTTKKHSSINPIGVIGIAGTVSLIVLVAVIGLHNVIRNQRHK